MIVKSRINKCNFIIYVNLNNKEYEVNNCSLFEYANWCDSAGEYEKAVREDIKEELQEKGKFTNEEMQEIMQNEKMKDAIIQIVSSARNW